MDLEMDTEEQLLLNSHEIPEDVKQKFFEARSRFRKYKILQDTIEECMKTSVSDNLNPQLKSKIRIIVLSHRCANATYLSTADSSNQHLLGLLQQVQSEKLTYPEGKELKRALLKALDVKYETICKEFKEMTGTSIDGVEASEDPLNPTPGPEHSLRKQLKEEIEKYCKNLLEEYKLLDEMMELRLKNMPEVCQEKVEECVSVSDLHIVKAKVVEKKTAAKIFTETNNTLPAYKKIIKDIKEQQEEYMRKNDYLQNLKEKYKQVSSKEFDEVVKNYSHFIREVEKMKMMLNVDKN